MASNGKVALQSIVIEGPQNARTDPDTGLRFYNWMGTEYPSVTTIRRLAGLPFGLHNWAVNKVIDRAITNYGALGALVAEGDDKATKKWMREAATEERDLAADKGNRVHFAAATGKQPDEVEDDIKAKVAQYEDFLAVTRADIIWNERQVWHLTAGYAGTADLLADLTVNGVRARYLLDLKTGKGLYLDHALQLMAYGGAEFVGENDTIDDYATTALHSATRMGIVHLTDVGWALHAVRPTPTLWEALIGLLAYARFVKDTPDVSALEVEEWGATGLTSPNLERALEATIREVIKP